MISNMKNVLWITGTFPPINCGIGRQYKLAKHLPKHGWNPIVLAFDKSIFRPQMDNELLKDIEGLEVHRTSSGENALLQGLIVPGLNKFGIKVNWWKVPDPWIRWKSHAFKEALKIFHTTPIDAIFSSALPYTCHLVARDLKRETGLPWIADFRDVWTLTDKSYSTKSQKQIKREEIVEEAVLREADWMTIVNDVVLEMMRNRFPFIKEKSSCITHGFDPEDYIDLLPTPKHNNIVKLMTYAGTLYGKRTNGAISFLKALKILCDDNPSLYIKLKVLFLGNCKQVEEAAKELGLWQVTFISWVSKRTALETLKSSDILLFLMGDSVVDCHATTGKLLDYIALDKPILAITPESPASKILKNVGGAIIAHPNDTDGIIQAIEEAMKIDRIERHNTEQYDIRIKAKEMAEVLERITK